MPMIESISQEDAHCILTAVWTPLQKDRMTILQAGQLNITAITNAGTFYFILFFKICTRNSL